jgi:hypothetical protein
MGPIAAINFTFDGVAIKASSTPTANAIWRRCRSRLGLDLGREVYFDCGVSLPEEGARALAPPARSPVAAGMPSPSASAAHRFPAATDQARVTGKHLGEGDR